MSRPPRSSSSRLLHPRLLSTPPHLTGSDGEHLLKQLTDIWSTLSAHGLRRLQEDGWKSLGIGFVQVESPGFRNLAEPLVAAWATLDARDSWGQTVIDIARRQHHWFPGGSWRILKALHTSSFDVYSVASRGGHLVLRRLRDGANVQVNATLDKSAYPGGSYVVARLVSIAGMTASLVSTVVSSESIRALAGARPIEKADWSRGWLQVSLHNLSQACLASRCDVVEPLYPEVSPRALARMERAYRAFALVFGRRSASIRTERLRDGAIHAARNRAGLEIHIRFDDGSFFGLERIPAAGFAAVDVEALRQSGIPQGDPGVSVRSSQPDALTDTDVDRIASALARAALKIADGPDQIAA